MNKLLKHYHKMVDTGVIKINQNQIALLEIFWSKYRYLFKNRFIYLLRKIIKRNASYIYLYGEPGRGKSMIVKIILEFLETSGMYFHINEINNFISNNIAKYSFNDIQSIMFKKFQNYNLIVIDELDIGDIVNGQFILEMFRYLERKKIMIIITSNYSPDLLCRNLHNKGIIEQITKFINTKFTSFNLSHRYDYRECNSIDTIKINFENTEELYRYFLLQNNIIDDDVVECKIISQKREIILDHTKNRSLFIDAKDLFLDNFNSIDYGNIMNDFDTFFIHNFAILSSENLNYYHRFVIFVDYCYELEKQLYIHFVGDYRAMIKFKETIPQIARTISRLNERCNVRR